MLAGIVIILLEDIDKNDTMKGGMQIKSIRRSHGIAIQIENEGYTFR